MARQLTAQDAAFVYMETPETPEHVGGVYLVELPEDYEGSFYERYKATIASRMEHIPLMRARLFELPLDLDDPFWVDVDDLDLDHHIRHLTAPSPGGMKELEELIALLHSRPLDRTRPLWELYVIDGLESGHQAIYSKFHHAAMDGATSQLIVNTIYDPTPIPRVLPPAPPAEPHKGGFAEIAEGVVAHLVRQQVRAAELVPELIKAWNHFVLPNARTLQWDPVAQTPRAPRTPMNVGITAERIWAARSLPLGAVKRISKETGSTVNDVILTLCSGALRDWLEGKDALPAEPLTALVPVSLHTPGNGDANQNGMFACSLASDVADAGARLAAVHRSAVEQKRRFDGIRNVPFPDLRLPGAGLLVRRLIEWVGTGPLRDVAPVLGNVLISNVPGPTAPLYIAGGRIVTMYPVSIPFHGAALNITVQSYCDRLDFGFTACRRALPDLARLADGLPLALAELQRALAFPVATALIESTATGVTLH